MKGKAEVTQTATLPRRDDARYPQASSAAERRCRTYPSRSPPQACGRPRFLASHVPGTPDSLTNFNSRGFKIHGLNCMTITVSFSFFLIVRTSSIDRPMLLPATHCPRGSVEMSLGTVHRPAPQDRHPFFRYPVCVISILRDLPLESLALECV